VFVGHSCSHTSNLGSDPYDGYPLARAARSRRVGSRGKHSMISISISIGISTFSLLRIFSPERPSTYSTHHIHVSSASTGISKQRKCLPAFPRTPSIIVAFAFSCFRSCPVRSAFCPLSIISHAHPTVLPLCTRCRPRACSISISLLHIIRRPILSGPCHFGHIDFFVIYPEKASRTFQMLFVRLLASYIYSFPFFMARRENSERRGNPCRSSLGD
jgi:hypothetical protein